MEKLYNLIIGKSERIKIKFLSDGRLWIVKVTQSKSAFRHKKPFVCSVEKIPFYIDLWKYVEVDKGVISLLEERKTKHSTELLNILESYDLLSSAN